MIEIDGTYCAVCGNRPSECDDVALTAREAALLTVDLLRFCRAVAGPLGVRGRPEVIPDLADVIRVGAVIPEPGLRYPVFLVIRPTPRSYCEVVGALAARNRGTPFGVLVPTNRSVTDGVERLGHEVGATIVPLDGALSVAPDGFVAAPEVVQLLASIGTTTVRLGTGAGAAATVVARALICDGSSPPQWRGLDEQQYQALLSRAADYHVLADQRRRTVRKGNAGDRTVPDSYFATIHCAVTSRRHYDPGVSGPDQPSAKQTFQRARSAFDTGCGKTSWRIFKTLKDDDRHAVYAFQPDPGVSFAFIFLPEGGADAGNLS